MTERDFQLALSSLERLVNEDLNNEKVINQFAEAFMNKAIQDGIYWYCKNWLVNELRCPTIFFVSRESPKLIAKGTTQFVFDIGYGYVAKIRNYGRTKDFYLFSTTDAPYRFPEEQNAELFKKLGLPVLGHYRRGVQLKIGDKKVPVKIPYCPEGTQEFIVVNRDSLNACICDKGFVIIADDARFGGYEIVEATEKQFQELSNGESIRNEYNKIKNMLLGIANGYNTNYGIKVLAHAEDECSPPLTAIEHLFGIARKENTGRLILMDLNHIQLYYKESSASPTKTN